MHALQVIVGDAEAAKRLQSTVPAFRDRIQAISHDRQSWESTVHEYMAIIEKSAAATVQRDQMAA